MNIYEINIHYATFHYILEGLKFGVDDASLTKEIHIMVSI